MDCLDHGLALAIERRGLVVMYLASCSELVTTYCVLDYFCVNCGVLCGVCIVGRELCATSAVAGHVLHSTRADTAPVCRKVIGERCLGLVYRAI
jgi:hypothetical protein